MANDAASGTRNTSRIMALVKADLGTKRVCPSCGARFYDLAKRPIECAKCSFAFEPEALYKQRRPRQPEAVAAVAPTAEAEDEEEEVEAEEEEAPIVEPIEGEPPLEVAEDDDEEEVAAEPEVAEGMSVVEGEDAAIEEIADEEVEDDDEDDGLLETVEEDEDDVSGIIDADIKEDER